MELSDIKGIGKTRLAALHAAGICSLRDLLYAVPYKYRDLSRLSTVAQARAGERVCLELVREGEAKLSRHGKLSRVTCAFSDATGRITACWFNQPWMRENMNRHTRLTLYGQVEAGGGHKRLMNPSVETQRRILPVYRPMEGVPQRVHAAAVQQALEWAEELCPETLPEELCRRHGLISCAGAIRALHAPRSMEEAGSAQRRFAFEQMLMYQAAIRLVRDVRRQGPEMRFAPDAPDLFWRDMPFAPTGAQRRTLGEIARDMAGKRAMARMVQGDVGSGKTAVAMGAMLLCAQAGYQSALMAPTEILARQHYKSMRAFFEAHGFGCGLLVGGMPARERRAALAKIAAGEWKAVIGTHALISEGVRYQGLGLCITDEQHRFGVAQRTALLNKGAEGERAPHLLVMSATPIPRSLALVMFGDLDLSIIDELPPGRQPVTTRIVSEEKREAMYGFLRKELEAGRQAYVVCPLVEESENADSLKAAKAHALELQSGALRGLRVGLTYGSQPAAEKAETLEAFAAGALDVLVATTVIEVGVNVPNASMMIIEDADHYGLAQLHQLRGRVGRGVAQSWCFLLAQPNERLRALVRTNDGFEISRVDLEQRGPGELLGTRQHGEALLPGGSAAFGSMQLLYEAAQCAETLQSDPAYRQEWQQVAAQAATLVQRLNERVSIS
ncbi:MAG: ATP-dependent DNA helicase RecG [Clostridiales bacterium]|nr:ATP-dependent DNA helicase RecG [Clostridiales bacterium]